MNEQIRSLLPKVSFNKYFQWRMGISERFEEVKIKYSINFIYFYIVNRLVFFRIIGFRRKYVGNKEECRKLVSDDYKITIEQVSFKLKNILFYSSLSKI
jgi:hypothetical protein